MNRCHRQLVLLHRGFNSNTGAAAGDLYSDIREQSTIPVLGAAVERVVVHQQLPAFVLIPPVVRRKGEAEVLPVNQGSHRRQTKVGSGCSGCRVHPAPE